MTGGQVVADTGDEIADVMLDGPAVLAHDVEVLVGMRDFPAPRVVAEPGLAHETEVREQGQGAVDGGEVDSRLPSADASREFIDGQVPVRPAKLLPNRAPWAGDALPSSAQ